MDGGLKSEPSPVAESLHRTLTSASSLFPPGLEALYRQAGFPPAAFLGLAAASSQSPGGPAGPGSGGGNYNLLLLQLADFDFGLKFNKGPFHI